MKKHWTSHYIKDIHENIKLTDLRYDSKCNESLHYCDMFLWIVNMYKQIVFISVQVANGVQFCYMTTVISATVDKRNAI